MPSIVYLSRYKKYLIGAGTTSFAALVTFEAYKLRKMLSSLVCSDVLDAEKKGPEYIYIKYHIYRELQMRAEEKKNSNMVNVFLNPFGKWWKSMEHSIAWRLLERAQKGDQHDRMRAICQLTVIDHLKDWDFQHLAQLCDARTAASLARSNCDSRWFLKPKMHSVLRNTKLILMDIGQLFEAMLPNKCISYFLHHHFNISNEREPDTDDLFVSQGQQLPQHDIDLLRKSVEEFLHLSRNQEYAYKIIANGGLAILIEIFKIFSNDSVIKSQLCNIIANLSVCRDMVEHFFVIGWIGILAEWTKDSDLRMRIMASKALANMDRDDPNNFEYMPKVYPLYPHQRTKQKPEADIIFIHGLLGSVFITWRQKDRVKKTNEKTQNGNGKKASEPVQKNLSIPEIKAKLMKKMELQAQNIDTSKSIEIDTQVSALNRIDSNNPSINIKLTEFYKEIMKTLDLEEGLSSDWEVVFPDCPLQSLNDNGYTAVSIPGNEFINQTADEHEEYTECWPMDWLPADFPTVRIIGCDYESNISHWMTTIGCSCDKSVWGVGAQLESRAKEFMEYLAASGVGQDRPVVFIGHSMGGLIAKSILVQSSESSDPSERAISQNTKGVLFLGTPHRGSPIAKFKQHTQILLSPTIEVVELKENSKPLLSLHDKFVELVKNSNQINVVSFIERLPTHIGTPLKLSFKLVTEESAFLEIGDSYILNEDHLGISKPVYRQSFLYQRIVKLLCDAIN